jgi:aldehyde dehydrogenase (NAD+)
LWSDAAARSANAFVCHPASRVVSFTGSTPVGRGIARLAADAPVMKRLELELGGNSPFVVLDDADLAQAVEAAVFGKFLHQGQICMIANRFIVDSEPAGALGRWMSVCRRQRLAASASPNDVERS